MLPWSVPLWMDDSTPSRHTSGGGGFAARLGFHECGSVTNIINNIIKIND
jgi:hypothetical protein